MRIFDDEEEEEEDDEDDDSADMRCRCSSAFVRIAVNTRTRSLAAVLLLLEEEDVALDALAELLLFALVLLGVFAIVRTRLVFNVLDLCVTTNAPKRFTMERIDRFSGRLASVPS